MQRGYVTVGNGQAEFIEKRSRFIGTMRHVETEAEARAFLAEICAAHREATHNVYCYILREQNTVRFSDDGEPQGTAGRPALEVLTREGVTDCALVITRYFGGILLGAGGLTRAYAAAAKMALDAAEKKQMEPCLPLLVTMGYKDWAAAENSVKKSVAEIADIAYGSEVTVTLHLPPEAEESLRTLLADLTAGKAVVEPGELFLRPVAVC